MAPTRAESSEGMVRSGDFTEMAIGEAVQAQAKEKAEASSSDESSDDERKRASDAERKRGGGSPAGGRGGGWWAPRWCGGPMDLERILRTTHVQAQ